MSDLIEREAGDLRFQLPRPGQPESSMMPGMAAPAVDLEQLLGLGAVVPDAAPAAPALAPLLLPVLPPSPLGGQQPGAWSYDFDPATGIARASYSGEIFNNGTNISGGPTTGTGATVLQNGPTIIAPTLSGAITNAGTISGGTVAGTITNAGTVSGGTVAGAIVNGSTIGNTSVMVGVTNASNAPAGDIGELIQNSPGSTSVTTATVTNLGSIVLTPGDWDVSGYLIVSPSVSITGFSGGVSTVSATLPTAGNIVTASVTTGGFGQMGAACPVQRQNITANTTVWAVGSATFSTGTCTITGYVYARRVR